MWLDGAWIEGRGGCLLDRLDAVEVAMPPREREIRLESWPTAALPDMVTCRTLITGTRTAIRQINSFINLMTWRSYLDCPSTYKLLKGFLAQSLLMVI